MMAERQARLALEEIMENLQCSICQDLYIEPKALPCRHRFCMQCLVELQQSQVCDTELKCPDCRQVTTIPEGDIKNLCTDFKLKSLVESVQDTRKTPHKYKIPACSSHEERKCELFCTTCSKLICLTCMMKSHRSHKCEEVRGMDVADKRQAIQAKVTQYQKAVTELTEALESAAEQNQNLEAAMGRIREEVEDKARQMKDQVDKSKQSILNKLDQIQKAREAELSVYSEDIHGKKATAQKHLDDSNLALVTNNKYEVLQKYTSLGTQGDYRCHIPSISGNPDVTFTPSEKAKDITVGKVSKQEPALLKIKGVVVKSVVKSVVKLRDRYKGERDVGGSRPCVHERRSLSGLNWITETSDSDSEA